MGPLTVMICENSIEGSMLAKREKINPEGLKLFVAISVLISIILRILYLGFLISSSFDSVWFTKYVAVWMYSRIDLIKLVNIGISFSLKVQAGRADPDSYRGR
jgi:hypothetical protein